MVADTDGVLSPLRLETYGLPELDEVSMLRRFHEEVARAGTTATLVTWGGATSDIPQLLPAAIHYNSKRTRSERVFRNGRQARYPARRALG